MYCDIIDYGHFIRVVNINPTLKSCVNFYQDKILKRKKVAATPNEMIKLAATDAVVLEF